MLGNTRYIENPVWDVYWNNRLQNFHSFARFVNRKKHGRLASCLTINLNWPKLCTQVLNFSLIFSFILIIVSALYN